MDRGIMLNNIMTRNERFVFKIQYALHGTALMRKKKNGTV